MLSSNSEAHDDDARDGADMVIGVDSQSSKDAQSLISMQITDTNNQKFLLLPH